MSVETQMKIEELRTDMYRALRKIDPSDIYSLKQVLPSMQEYMRSMENILTVEGTE